MCGEDRVLPEVPYWLEEDLRDLITECLSYCPDERPLTTDLIPRVKEMLDKYYRDEKPEENDYDEVDGADRMLLFEYPFQLFMGTFFDLVKLLSCFIKIGFSWRMWNLIFETNYCKNY